MRERRKRSRGGQLPRARWPPLANCSRERERDSASPYLFCLLSLEREQGGQVPSPRLWTRNKKTMKQPARAQRKRGNEGAALFFLVLPHARRVKESRVIARRALRRRRLRLLIIFSSSRREEGGCASLSFHTHSFSLAASLLSHCVQIGCSAFCPCRQRERRRDGGQQ